MLGCLWFTRDSFSLTCRGQKLFDPLAACLFMRRLTPQLLFLRKPRHQLHQRNPLGRPVASNAS